MRCDRLADFLQDPLFSETLIGAVIWGTFAACMPASAHAKL